MTAESCFAPEYVTWTDCSGRFLAGSGAGAASLYVPRYLAEIAPVSIRGGIATLNQASFNSYVAGNTTFGLSEMRVVLC